MADNFLERHRAEYEQRKARWLKRKNRCHIQVKRPQKEENTGQDLSDNQA